MFVSLKVFDKSALEHIKVYLAAFSGSEAGESSI